MSRAILEVGTQLRIVRIDTVLSFEENMLDDLACNGVDNELYRELEFIDHFCNSIGICNNRFEQRSLEFDIDRSPLGCFGMHVEIVRAFKNGWLLVFVSFDHRL